MVALPTRAPAVPTVNQDFQSFWNEECSYSVSERFKVPGIDTKSNVNTNTSAVTTVTEEGTTEPELVVVDEKEELRNRARELVASLHNFGAIDTKTTTSSDTTTSAGSRSSKAPTSSTATTTNTDSITAAATATPATTATATGIDTMVDVRIQSANPVIAKRHSVHVFNAASTAPRPVLTNTTRSTILSTTNSETLSKMFPQLQHHLQRSPDSPAPPTVSVETREAPAPGDIKDEEHTEQSETTRILSVDQPTSHNAAVLPSDAGIFDPKTNINPDHGDNLNSDDEQSVLSKDSSMNDSLEYASHDNYADSILLPGLSLSAESDCDSVSINLSSPRQKNSNDAFLSEEPVAVQQSTSKKHDNVVKASSPANVNIRNKSPSPTVPLSPSQLQVDLSNIVMSCPESKSAKEPPPSPNNTNIAQVSAKRVPQAPSTPLTSPERPRFLKPRAEEASLSTKSPTSNNPSGGVVVSTTAKGAMLSKGHADVVYTDTITASSSVQSISDSRPVGNINFVPDTVTQSTAVSLRDPSTTHKSSAVATINGPHQRGKNSDLAVDNDSNINSPAPYADVDEALLMLNVRNVGLTPIAPPGGSQSTIANIDNSGDVGDLCSSPDADNTHLNLTSDVNRPLNVYPTVKMSNNHSYKYNTVNMLPFGLEHLRGIWPYDPSISAYQYMLQLYATRRLNEQKQRERHIQLMRERRKQKQDRQPLHMKHALRYCNNSSVCFLPHVCFVFYNAR